MSGWVDVADIAQKKLELSDPSTLTKEVVVDKDEQFSGSVENFDGKASFVNEKGETVEVNFQKEDGTMAQAGETVIGSDGREYQVENLDVKATETGETRTTWSLADAAKVAALASGASAALLAAFGRKRKEKEMTDMTGAQIRDLILDSEQNYELGKGEGFNRDVEAAEVRKAIDDDTVGNLLNHVPVKKNDLFFIESGTVHAIGAGCLICEVQQNSNSTYRMYDFDRTDKYGNKRKLDMKKALDVSDIKKYVPGRESKYFNVRIKKCVDSGQLNITEESFAAILILEGEGEISYKGETLEFSKGNCVFIPAKNARMKFSGTFEYVDVRI